MVMVIGLVKSNFFVTTLTLVINYVYFFVIIIKKCNLSLVKLLIVYIMYVDQSLIKLVIFGFTFTGNEICIKTSGFCLLILFLQYF